MAVKGAPRVLIPRRLLEAGTAGGVMVLLTICASGPPAVQLELSRICKLSLDPQRHPGSRSWRRWHSGKTYRLPLADS